MLGYITLYFYLILMMPGLSGIQPAETRGIWMDRTELCWEKSQILNFLDDLKAADFGTIYVCAYYQALVPYPDSKLLPQDPQLTGQDVFSWLVPECHKRGLKVQAWIKYGFYAYHTKDAQRDESRGAILDNGLATPAINNGGMAFLRNPGWGDFYYLCPSSPHSHELLIELCREIITRYDFDGLNLDRIKYPNNEFCFCPHCQREFQKDTDLELKHYEPGSAGYKAFIAWRKQKITEFMQTLSAELREYKPGIAITATVVPPEEIDNTGQDWPTWLKQGYVDAVIPVLNGRNIKPMVRQILGNASEHRGDPDLSGPGEAPVYYGLDAQTNPAALIVKQIQDN